MSAPVATTLDSESAFQLIVATMRRLARDECLPQHLLERDVALSDTIDALGIDSVGRINVVGELEMALGRSLDENACARAQTIAELVAILADRA